MSEPSSEPSSDPSSAAEAIAYTAPDYLDRYPAALERETITALRCMRRTALFAPAHRCYWEAVAAVRDIASDYRDFSAAAVAIGRGEDLTPEQGERWLQALRVFCPWKKGPFRLFDTFIDAEWRSDWKWARLLPHIHPLRGRKVADIGCHNGYFMLRMTHEEPDCVIGFEPVARHFWNFQLLQNIVRCETLSFEPLGIEQIHHYRGFFDTVFCLGVLYHHSDPIGLLRKLRLALARGGELVIDCQGIPGRQAFALTPRKRYANARGIWFLPTRSCLENWLMRAGFSRLRCIFAAPLSVAEQRRTDWADIASLNEFLDPADPTLTIEGYPAPWRYYMIAR